MATPRKRPAVSSSDRPISPGSDPDSDVAILRQELDALRTEVATLRASLASAQTLDEAHAIEFDDGGELHASTTSTSRRALLKWGGLGAAAALAAGAAGLSQAPTAHANSGDNFILGGGNTAENGTGLVYDGGESFPTGFLLQMNGSGSSAGLGIVAEAGDGVNDYAAGVQASAGNFVNHPTYGVSGFTGINGTGVIGQSTASGTSVGIGVEGVANGIFSFGVLGVSDIGYGVVAASSTGIDIWAGSTGRFLQIQSGFVGAPTGGSYAQGEQIRDNKGDFYICIKGGSPGVWRKVAAGVPGVSGAINFLANPIRLLDTRSGSPWSAGSTHALQVTGVSVGGVSVPSGAIGVVGNVTVTQPSAGGDLRLYPGATAPSTSSINFANGWTIANGVTVGLNGSGQLNIKVDMPTSTHTHVLFDASGYIL